MKKMMLIPLTTLLFLKPAEAQDKESSCRDDMNFYAKALGGWNFLQDSKTNGNKASYKTGYIIDGSLGYSWRHYGLRFESEYAYRRNGISKINFTADGSSKNGHFRTSSVMGNVLWDFPFCTITPFIGMGVGADFQKMHAKNRRIVFNQKWTHFAWQAIAGFSFPIFCNTELTVEYKFHQGGTAFNNHAIGAGLVYKFGYIN